MQRLKWFKALEEVSKQSLSGDRSYREWRYTAENIKHLTPINRNNKVITIKMEENNIRGKECLKEKISQN
jgi:hypothetical protein